MSTFLTLCSLVNQEHDSLWCHIYCRWRTYFKTSPLFWVHCAQALWGCHWARLRAWNRWPFFQMQCFQIFMFFCRFLGRQGVKGWMKSTLPVLFRTDSFRTRTDLQTVSEIFTRDRQFWTKQMQKICAEVPPHFSSGLVFFYTHIFARG